jgi:hypothetical protein
MRLTERLQWIALSGLVGAAAAQLTDHVMTSGWRLAARKDPPEDPLYKDVDWTSAAMWAVAAASVGALAQLVARKGTATVWRHATGHRPPQRRRRPRIHSAREALT